MVYVYSLSDDEFCASTFEGDHEIARINGYKEISYEDYSKLLDHTAHWVKGELEYREKTEEEIAIEQYEKHKAEVASEIADLKTRLSSTDYQAIKFSEGWITVEEYAPIKAQRQNWRNRINELEQEND